MRYEIVGDNIVDKDTGQDIRIGFGGVEGRENRALLMRQVQRIMNSGDALYRQRNQARWLVAATLVLAGLLFGCGYVQGRDHGYQRGTVDAVCLFVFDGKCPE